MPQTSPNPQPLADLPAEQAVPLLVEEHGGQLYRLALKFCGNPEDAEDLVQEVFLIVWRKWHTFEGNASPTTWLYTIAARACQRRRRKRSGEPDHIASLDQLLPLERGPISHLPDAPDDPHHHRLKQEAREHVEQALTTLPEHYRMALVLKDIVELSIREVAQILDIPEATVKTRVHRARLQLRQALENLLPRKETPPPLYDRQVCMDLLQARQEALDRGVNFPVPEEEVCERCQALFSTLDLTRAVCADLGRGKLPDSLTKKLLAPPE